MADDALWMVMPAKPQLPEPLVLAKALAAARKTPVQDQINPAKRGWGIVAENIREAEAKSLAEQLSKSGLEMVALPASALVKLPDAGPVKRMEPGLADGLTLIAAGSFMITSTTTTQVKEGPSAAQKILSTAILLGTGLPIKIGGKERTVEKTQQESDRVFYVDLIYKNPLRRSRIDAQRFDYSFLKERKQYQMFGNFKLLLGDLAQASKAAWHNHGTRILLEGRPIQTMGYESLADVERETRWLLTLESLK